jgi:hypothetical protein
VDESLGRTREHLQEIPRGPRSCSPTTRSSRTATIALKLEVPWHAALDAHIVRLELLDADGQPVLAPSPDGDAPVRVEARLDPQQDEMPENAKPGIPIDVALAFNFPPLPLPPASRFEWRLTIDGESRGDWFLAFGTRRAPEPER